MVMFMSPVKMAKPIEMLISLTLYSVLVRSYIIVVIIFIFLSYSVFDFAFFIIFRFWAVR